MAYKVLYRKYRPNDFENIVDQNYTIDILKNSITSNKISHAYIFSGPRGTGKTTTAKVFAKSINCENFNEKGPCGKCFNCENFNNSPDIIEIDAASNNGVDEIRDLIHSVKLAPTNSKYKVYIIDEVHMLTQSAFNALLLTLEEPPKHVVFILATTNIENVPVTILSRCQRFDFKKISNLEIINRLKYVCKNEKIKIEEEALEEIADLSDGGMRDALSILDQISNSDNLVTIEHVIKHFGTVSNKRVNDLIDALEINDNSQIIKIMDEFRKSSVEYKNLIKKLLDVLYKRAILSKEENYNGLDYTIIKNLCFDLVECINKINVAIDPFMLIELTILNYTNQNKTNVAEEINNSVKEKVSNKEIVVANKEVVTQSAVDNSVDNISDNDKEFKNTRINNCFVNARKEYLLEIKEKWDLYIDLLKSDKNLLTLVIDAVPVAASDKYVILTTNLQDTAELINTRYKELEEKFKSIINSDYMFVSLTETEWDSEKREYINNIKSGKKYTLIAEEEKIVEELNDELESLAKDIFGQDKIEYN